MKNIFLRIVLTTALSPLGEASGQSLKEASRAWNEHVQNSMRQTQTSEFKEVTKNIAAQSTAAVNAATAPTGGNYFPIANSSEASDLAKNLQTENRRAIDAVGAAQIEKAKANLPKFTPLSNKNNQGQYFVSSDKGSEIISLIRSLPTSDPARQSEFLKKIYTFGKQDYPEAINFIGVILEYGLFGAKRDVNKALTYYMHAADVGYQPAIFNAANFLFYGKDGSQNNVEARRLILRAYGLGRDNSNRVCGLASFMNFRAGQFEDALRFSSGCASPLAKLSSAFLTNKNTYRDRIAMIRESIATGADDGFPLLVKIASKYTDDKENLFCKYRLVNQVRFSSQLSNLASEALGCYTQIATAKGLRQSRTKQDADVNDIVNFVQVELKTLEAMRRQNRFHYSWSVPYLPFGDIDVDLFEQTILKAAKWN